MASNAAASSTNSNTITVPAELPTEVARIFAERIEVAGQPLPGRISDDQCNGRQLFMWRNMGYSWQVIQNRMHPPNDQKLGSFMTRMRNRVQRWLKRNAILEKPSGRGELGHDQVMDLAVERYTAERQWFFGVLGEYNLSNFTYVPALDRDSNMRLDPPVANPASFPLPAPRDVPAWLRPKIQGKLNLPPFVTWLERNAVVYQHYFPNRFRAWQESMPPGPQGQQPHPASQESAAAQALAAGIQQHVTIDSDDVEGDDDEDGRDGTAPLPLQQTSGQTEQIDPTPTATVPAVFGLRTTASATPGIPVMNQPVKKQRRRRRHSPDSESSGDRDNDLEVARRIAGIKETLRRAAEQH